MFKKILLHLLFLILVTNCDYSPVYLKSENSKLNINIIEIKGDYTPFIEERIQEIIRSYKGPIALKSFSLKSIKWIIEFLPFVFKGLVVDEHTNNSEIIFDIDLDFISCDINYVDSDLIIKARKNGLSIITWTIDNVEKKDKADLFADNIIFEKITP